MLTVASVVNLVRSQFTLSVYLCLQNVCRDAARRAGSSATANTCNMCCTFVRNTYAEYLKIDHLGDVLVSQSLRPSAKETKPITTKQTTQK